MEEKYIFGFSISEMLCMEPVTWITGEIQCKFCMHLGCTCE